MLKPLIVGIGGGVASRIAAAFTKKGISFAATSSRPLTEYWQLDLTRPREFDYSLVNSEHLVLLAAAISSPDRCQKEYEIARQTNVTGTLEFAQRCLEKGAQVLFFSSDTVYGASLPGNPTFTETDTLNPLGEYAQMKAEAEASLLALGNVKIVRLSYVFFKQDKFTTYLSKCALNGQEAEVFDPFTRSMVYIQDLIEAIEAYGDRWIEIHDKLINVGGPSPVSRWDFALKLQELVYPELKLLKIEPPLDFFKARPRLIALNTAPFANLLGRPVTPIEEAIAQEFTEI
ncbi:NAD(P)-dependent oxidoreductase [Gloeocapsa sp. PCC 73106]|uniref:NAD-dependent epimerase/dehydratase family protein n=1 Tax=Gloeocapsa sp. PCC 73106 TaxID=102232 RepID=UPI0002ACB2C2|nr:sugar nucleotide-binding protein [Gloeocapsa sp. PCC 73106]ELR96428.1 dTDP-4-dehydrorhamnose reductase [Gloeocapsa sp. PCC 73106]